MENVWKRSQVFENDVVTINMWFPTQIQNCRCRCVFQYDFSGLLYTENIWCAFKVKKPFYIFLTYCISRNLAANYLEGSESGVCKSADLCPFFAKSVEPPIFLFNWSETTATFGNRSVKLQRKTGKCEWHCINFSQILVKKATCLITMTRAPAITQYNRPFYGCLFSGLAFEWQQGWRWPCFD